MPRRANDTYGLGFRRNYGIAILLMVGAQVARLVQGMTDGAGGESASKSIRLDINRKLSTLAMPYLWDPAHSTAQLVDLVAKDPEEYRLFAMMPLILASASFPLVRPGTRQIHRRDRSALGACMPARGRDR